MWVNREATIHLNMAAGNASHMERWKDKPRQTTSPPNGKGSFASSISADDSALKLGE